jgi:hypothetical protein
MTDSVQKLSQPQMVSGRSARKAAAMFNIGNIIGIAVPIPLGLLWLGISMVVYAMNRHHPNPRVGHYTQQAAYRFYAITGFFVAIGAFIPRGNWVWYAVAWGAAAAILIPWSIIDLVRIRREQWHDVEFEKEMGE